jgi:beta-lactamase class A
MLSRRGIIASVGGLGLAGGAAMGTLAAVSLPSPTCACVKTIEEWCDEAETASAKRIGIFLTGWDRDEPAAWRADERFAMCSTFKWVLAAAILHAEWGGKVRLDQTVSFTQADLLDHAPVARANIAKGRLTVEELCAAIVTVSDNTAANLLLPLVGGPEGLTGFVRFLGDEVTRFDRMEPELNSNLPGDPRDTTTPRAMTLLLQQIFTNGVLTDANVLRLKAWMVAASTGKDMIRAGVPWSDAVTGDKTGRGANGAVNDVAVIWRPDNRPLFLSIYTTGGNLSGREHDKLVAGIANFALRYA